jgi:hypothetical protein
MGVNTLKLPIRVNTQLRVPLITQNIGNILCLALIGLTLAVSIPLRQNTHYYRMIDEEDYQAFAWIKENVREDYDKAILDPWKATAFTAVTGKKVYARTHIFPSADDVKADEFLSSGSSNTTFLRENGISIVYYKGAVDNSDLVEVGTIVYLLKENEQSQ